VFYFFEYGNNEVLAWTSSMILLVVGVAYMILHCCCRNKAESEEYKPVA
jgi:hypothetical protein